MTAPITEIRTFSVRARDIDSHHARTLEEASFESAAVAYVEAEGPDGATWWGVGMDSSILDASLAAVVSAANRAREQG